jgi:very-short-patch-repair endonuclease
MRTTRKTRTRAKELRRNLTRAETILWTRLQKRRLLGFHFCKQAGAEPYIIDFACRSIRLAIEVDGATHSSARERDHDARRTRVLERNGWTIVRFWNDEIYTNEQGVVDTIAQCATTLLEEQQHRSALRAAPSVSR